jgi:hypothetical protein
MVSALLALRLASAAAAGPAVPAATGPALAPAANPQTQAIPLEVGELRRMVGEAAGAATPGAVQAAGYRLACTPGSGAQATCRFGRALGRIEVEPSFELDGRIPVRRLRLQVAGGRVTAISFRVSPDAYDTVQSLFDAAYGQPVVSRGRLRTEIGPRPQVKMVWRGPRTLARVTDPALPDLRMLVTVQG